MQGLAANQKKILDYLLSRPAGATLDELSEHLGITRSGVKEHVVKLQAYGYVAFEDDRGGVGRPKRRYLLSPEGQEAFPRQYSWLSNELLELLAQDLGPEAVSKLMTSLGKKVADSMGTRLERARENKTLLPELTQILNELGYRASLKQSDVRKGAVMEATNCVYHSVAKRHPELCLFDVQFLQRASGLNVKLESCIARGASVCRFCLRNKGEEGKK
jgi:DeoR family transcriptional regulator, suf operon transcriptional repressor